MSNLLNLIRKSAGRYTIKIRGAGVSRDGKHSYFTKQEYIAHWQEVAAKNELNMRNVSVDAFTFHDRAGTLHREDRGANLLNIGTVRQIDPEHRFHCSRLDEWLHFKWNGDIVLCCMDYHAEVKLPNITKMSLLDYFHGREHFELIEQISGLVGCKPGHICTRCTSPGG